MIEWDKEKMHQWGFFNAIRWCDALAPQRPYCRTGFSQKLADDHVRFGQKSMLNFPPADMQACKRHPISDSYKFSVNFLGLLGNNGPMPLQLSNYIHDREKHHHDHTLSRFLDIFHHRMTSFYYRAWASADQCTSFDHPEDDYFSSMLSALIGEQMDRSDGLPDKLKLYYSGHFIQDAGTAQGLTFMLENFLGVKVEVEEFAPQWLKLPEDDCWRLGQQSDQGLLGQSAFLGDRICDYQHKINVIIGPLTLDKYKRLLPKTTGLSRVMDMIKGFVDFHLDWKLVLRLKPDEVPQTCLNGSGALGYSSWLKKDSQPLHDEGCLVMDDCSKKISKQDRTPQMA